MLDGQLCYQADVDKFSDLVDKKKMVTEGFVFLLDYNEDRMVNEGLENRVDKDLSFIERKEDNDVMIYADTIGENQNRWAIFTAKGQSSNIRTGPSS